MAGGLDYLLGRMLELEITMEEFLQEHNDREIHIHIWKNVIQNDYGSSHFLKIKVIVEVTPTHLIKCNYFHFLL